MAVVATPVVVLQVPAEMAMAEPLRVQQTQMAPQQEPDRTIGPAAAVKMGSVKASVSLDQPLKSNVGIPPVTRKAEKVVTTVLSSEAGDEPAAD